MKTLADIKEFHHFEIVPGPRQYLARIIIHTKLYRGEGATPEEATHNAVLKALG